MGTLNGQVAIVTGGGRGLGQGMAIALARAGAAVCVAARSATELAETVSVIEKDNGRAISVVVDVADHNAVGHMVQRVEQELGPVDLLVNNAGLSGKPCPIWDADPLDWERTVGVNLNGAYFCAQAVLKGMVKRQRGRIINVETAGILFVAANMAPYLTSKIALQRLTECIAVEGSPYGITCFGIDPGTVKTAMADYLMESDAGRTHIPWFRDYVLSGQDVPAELSAQLVVRLASGAADALSGRFIQVTDDVDSMLGQVERIKRDNLCTIRVEKLT